MSNKFSIKALNDKISYETWYEEKPDLSNLRVYECDAYTIDYHAKNKNKMIKRVWIDILVSYEVKNQWRIFDEKSIFIRKNVIFNEKKLTYKNSDQKTSADSSYSGDEMNDPFQSVKNGDDQSVRND